MNELFDDLFTPGRPAARPPSGRLAGLPREPEATLYRNANCAWLRKQEKRQEKLARRDERKANKGSGLSPFIEDDPKAYPERGLDFDDSVQDEAS